MRKVVGIDRKIKRAWLDAALDRLAQTTDPADLRTFLDRLLKDELPSKESRAKSTGIILRIWSGIPPERAPLRDRAVALLARISGQERIWLHWGMTALAYPFFRDTAEVVGRLLALQDDFTTAHVQGRMLTNWGDRATSKEAAQKLITMLVDWEVLRSTKTKGHFLLARKMAASIPDLQLWLMESLLGASAADEIEVQQLMRLPESFPFMLTVGVADLRSYEGFNIHRQGLDMDMVALHKVKLEPPPKTAKKPKTRTAPTPAHADLFGMQAQDETPTNGKPAPVSVAPSVILPAGKQQGRPTDPQRLKEAIKDELIRSLSEKAAGLPKVQAPISVPEYPFASPSAECTEQFRVGNYFGCIALTHAVLEAVIRHIWQINFKKKPDQDGGFIKNLEALHKKKLISDELQARLDLIWAERSSFLHFNPVAKCDQQRLEDLARSALELLNRLQKELVGLHAQNATG